MQWVLQVARGGRTPLFGVGLALTLALIAALLAIGTADADTSASPPLTLQPGDNYVGWVAEPIAVDDIFEQVSAANLIYHWDAAERMWEYAIRGVGGNLETLEAGMAVTIRIAGDHAVKWERPHTPAKGGITLYRGVNWVTWLGRDDWPLDQVARGIGESLVSIRVGEETWAAPFDDDEKLPTLSRGDAVEVVVNRDLRWLQPTGMMPNIVFVGDISDSLQEEITEDVRRVRDFFAETFAIETDFSTTTVMLYSDFDAAVEHERAGKQPSFGYSPEHLLGNLRQGRTGQARPWGYWMSACGWMSPIPEPCVGRTIETLVHEWFHVFQSQLSARRDVRVSPVWMNEGAATWSEFEMPAALGNRGATIEGHGQWRLEFVKQDSAPLESLGNIYAGGRNYILGLFAVQQLVDSAGFDSALEFNRQLFPQIVGSERLWEQSSSFDEAFENTFGLTTPQFYRQYAEWRETLPEPTQRINYDPRDIKLSGSLHYSDGAPATGFLVLAEEYEGEISVGVERTTIVNEEGEFTLHLVPNTIQRFWFKRDNCTLQLAEHGPTTARLQPGEHRDIDMRNIPDLDLILPEGACENEIRINVTKLRGDDRYHDVLLIDAETGDWSPTRLGASGAYVGYAPKAGDYQVRVRLDDCGVFYSKDGMVGARRDADVLELSSDPVSIEFRIPRDLCVWQISGRIVDEDGVGVGGGWIQAHSHGRSSSAAVSEDGRFAFEVPESGGYVLFVGTDVPDCHIVYTSSGGSAEWRDHTLVTVADADVTGIEFVVPSDPASLCR